jgi:pyruvate dehydrogenase E1 component beta subunit
LAAAEKLSGDGVEVEVIDLRSLQPWDERAVFQSIAKTHRVVVVHEAVQAFGIGAEIAARIGEDAFDELDAPVVRVGAPYMPVPFSSELEHRYAVNAESVIRGLRKVLA